MIKRFDLFVSVKFWFIGYRRSTKLEFAANSTKLEFTSIF